MRPIRRVIAIFMALTAVASAAELPVHAKRPKPPEAAKKCNVGGMPGVLAANNVCVKLSGYVSAGFNAGQIK